VPLRQFTFRTDLQGDAGAASIAFDDGRVYISSPDGSVIAGDSLRSSFRTIFRSHNHGISNIYVRNHTLYVLTGLHQAESDVHAMFQSKDRGSRFTAIDGGLRVCAEHGCSYLTADQLLVKKGLLFANAGGGINLQVSPDEGTTWLPLSGSLDGQVCYSSHFAITGHTVLQGGECPLDSAFLSRGILSHDRQALISPLMPARTPDLGNRKVNVIAYSPAADVVLAGGEGTILRSVDDGRGWRTVMREPLDGDFYPYVQNFQFSSSQPGLVFAGGFDKGGERLRPYLAFSKENGVNWANLSGKLGGIREGVVSDLKEDASGRLIAVVIDAEASKVIICQILVGR
jgi:hypothetical protein